MTKKIVLVVLLLLAIPACTRAWLQYRAFGQAEEHFHAGDNYLNNGGSGAAKAEFEQAVTLYPEYQGAWIGLVECELVMKEWDEALASCDKAHAILPKVAEFAKMKSTAYRQKGDPANEIASLQEAARIDPSDPLVANLLKRALKGKATPLPATPSPDGLGKSAPTPGSPTPAPVSSSPKP